MFHQAGILVLGFGGVTDERATMDLNQQLTQSAQL